MDKYLEYQLEELYKPILDAFGSLAQEQTAAMNQAARELARQLTMHVQKQLDQFYRVIGGSIQEMLDRAEVDANEVGPLLEQANFWLSPSMNLDLLYALKAIAESGDATPERIVSAFVEYYEDDEWAKLKGMVSSWHDNHYFVDRMHIITDALEAHLDGKYTLVIPALLSQVEGIASSILETPAGRSTELVKSAVTDRQGEFLRAASKDILIKFVTSPMGYGSVPTRYFTPEKFHEWLESKGVPESQSINRHGILHGVDVHYDSKEKSLRVFLLLDVFYGMRRDEWDPRLRVVLRNSQNRGGI